MIGRHPSSGATGKWSISMRYSAHRQPAVAVPMGRRQCAQPSQRLMKPSTATMWLNLASQRRTSAPSTPKDTKRSYRHRQAGTLDDSRADSDETDSRPNPPGGAGTLATPRVLADAVKLI
jgi:hypothetical protein